MKQVVPVRFKYNPKTYWFTYSDCAPRTGDWVLVVREGGKSFGWVEEDPFQISDEQVSALKSPLRSIMRVATEEDLRVKQELDAKGREAKQVFRQLAEKRELGIKPIDVEYMYDTDRAIFHFSSEDRVDFRELVRDLAAQLHVHVDMKQIGVRDEARLVGGLGHCGEVLCCVRVTSAFQPVSIKMAKDQDLPLNPSKVSGACGRLMCCLRYESEAYKDYKSRAPKVGTVVQTPAGDAKVVELNTPKELVRLKMIESGETFFVPLAAMDPEQLNEQGKPHVVGDEAFGQYGPAALLREKVFEIPLNEQLVDEEQSKQSKRRHRKGDKKKAEGQNGSQAQAQQTGKGGEQDGRPQRRQQSKRASDEQPTRGGQKPRAVASESETAEASAAKPKRRRQRHKSQGGQGGAATAAEAQAQQAQPRPKQRPGQNSSNIRNPQDLRGQGEQGQQAQHKSGSGNRRRRRGGSGNGGAGGGQHVAQQAQQRQEGQRQTAQHEGQGGQRRRQPRRTSGGATGAVKPQQPKQGGGAE